MLRSFNFKFKFMVLNRYTILSLMMATILTTGCGKPKLGFVDAKLAPYRDLFVQVCAIYRTECDVKHISLSFMPKDILGRAGNCQIINFKDGTSERHITINKSVFSYLNAAGREALVFHEYGHCFLAREHLDAHLNDGTESSVMSTVLINSHDFETNLNYYLDELFNRETK